MNNSVRISLVVTDMDGTFLATDKSLIKENIDSIERLTKMNIPVIFCTGRPISFVEHYVNNTKVMPIVIGSNGAVIKNISTGGYISQSYFNEDLLQKLIIYCHKLDFDFLAYSIDGRVFFSKHSQRVKVFHKYNADIANSSVQKVELIPIEDNLDEIFRTKICKILITKKHNEDLNAIKDFITNYTNAYVVSSMENVLDIMPHNVSKGLGIEKISNFLNIPIERIGVIGDNKNDISMFEKAVLSVCLANGDECVRKFASHVTKRTNDESGFSEAVEWLLSQK